MFMTLKGGLNELIDTLAGRLNGVRKVAGQTVVGLERLADQYRLRLADGTDLAADSVVLAVPARDAAGLLEGIDERLATRLRALRYVSTATVSFGFRKKDLSHPLDGFGFVIPSKERRRITGCTWSSTKFDGRAPADGALVRCFLGGAADESSALVTEDEMVRLARKELRDLMGIDVEPAKTWVYRWRDGHVQYDVGHLERVAEIERLSASYPGLHLTGSSYRGIGLPDCIHNGALAAESVLKGTMSLA